MTFIKKDFENIAEKGNYAGYYNGCCVFDQRQLLQVW